MVRAVEHGNLDIDHREAGEHARLDGFLDALVDRGDELARNRAALDDVLEHVAAAGRQGLDLEPAVAVLAATAGLAHELAFAVDRLADGFAVGDLRLADVGFNAVLTLHAVDENFKVQLAHAGDDGLAGFLVGVHAEGRIFDRQLLQGEAHLFLVDLGLRLDGLRNHGCRELHALENDLVVRIAERGAGGDVRNADAGSDVAGAHFVNGLALVGVHLDQAADALLLAGDRVVDRVTGVQHAGVDADESQRADKLVGHDLECQGRERLAVVGVPLDQLGLVVRIGALDRRNFGRRREIINHGVEHHLHALVLERTAADHRDDVHPDGALTQAGADLFLAQRVRLKT